MADAVKFNTPPSQTGALVEIDGEEGTVLITTGVVAELLVHCPTFTVTEYDPASAVVALLMTGFCKEELNPLGPVQL
jgi:hypothetical protein